MEPPVYITAVGISKLVGVELRTVLRWAAKPSFPRCVPIEGSRRRWVRKQIVAFLQLETETAPPPDPRARARRR